VLRKPSRRPASVRDLVQLYDYLYRQERIVHPKKGPLALYGAGEGRNEEFITFLEDREERGARVLDASCGRGHLARDLIRRGYVVHGTEISRWLVERELTDFPCFVLTYDRLDELTEKSYDVVISNDVLEHLLNEDAVRQAVRSFKRLAKKYVLISVGTKRQPTEKYPIALGIRHVGALHTFTPGRKWWKRFFREELDVVREVAWESNQFALCRVPESHP
jgi:2-polyprenyl-3-methyl-5-hydroxy-6-metoxy-1,4-benzoquinol methylase